MRGVRKYRATIKCQWSNPRIIIGQSCNIPLCNCNFVQNRLRDGCVIWWKRTYLVHEQSDQVPSRDTILWRLAEVFECSDDDDDDDPLAQRHTRSPGAVTLRRSRPEPTRSRTRENYRKLVQLICVIMVIGFLLGSYDCALHDLYEQLPVEYGHLCTVVSFVRRSGHKSSYTISDNNLTTPTTVLKNATFRYRYQCYYAKFCSGK